MEERLEFLEVFKERLKVEPMAYATGSCIVEKSKTEQYVHAVDSGIVKVVDYAKKSQPSVIAYLKRGEVFPLIWAFDHPPATTYKYEALGVVKTLSVSRMKFRETLASDVDFTKQAFEMFVNLAWDLMERIKDLQMSYTTDRLIRLLPYIAAKTGVEVEPRVYKLPSYLTQYEIALLLGVTRESISTHMSKPEVQRFLYQKEGSRYVDLREIPENYIFEQWFRQNSKVDGAL